MAGELGEQLLAAARLTGEQQELAVRLAGVISERFSYYGSLLQHAAKNVDELATIAAVAAVRELRPASLSGFSWDVLNVLPIHDAWDMPTIAEAVMSDHDYRPSAVSLSYTLAMLQERGLTECVPVAQGRYLLRYRLTDLGKSMVGEGG